MRFDIQHYTVVYKKYSDYTVFRRKEHIYGELVVGLSLNRQIFLS